MKTTLRFFYNGIKDSDGKLQKCSYHLHLATGEITIYGNRYRDFSAEIAEAFNVVNNTDSQTDYFENDSICVLPDHPLYNDVLTAALKSDAHKKARAIEMKYFTPIQAGQQVGLSHQRIRALCGKGLIPGAVKVGKSWIIPANFSITRNGSRGPQSTITGAQQ